MLAIAAGARTREGNQFLDFPVQDFGAFGSVKFREVMTDIQQETYRRCDFSTFLLLLL